MGTLRQNTLLSQCTCLNKTCCLGAHTYRQDTLLSYAHTLRTHCCLGAHTCHRTWCCPVCTHLDKTCCCVDAHAYRQDTLLSCVTHLDRTCCRLDAHRREVAVLCAHIRLPVLSSFAVPLHREILFMMQCACWLDRTVGVLYLNHARRIGIMSISIHCSSTASH